MIMIPDLVGDEDTHYLNYKEIEYLLQQRIYKALEAQPQPSDGYYYTFRYPGTIHCVSFTTEIK